MRFAIIIAAAAMFLVACRTRSARPASATTAQEPAYADAKACAICHAAIAETYRRTGMARSFYRPRPENTVEDYTRNNTFYHKASDTWFRMLRRDGKFYQRRWQLDADGRETHVDELQIDCIMGSGNHVRTYLHRTIRGTLIELPLGWYPERGGIWAMNPGYEGSHLETRRKVAYECMFCHNAYPEIPANSEEPVYRGQLPEGIDCQRCHGPGAAHVRAAQSGAKNVRETILNPARLSADRQMEVCMQCHLQTSAEALPSELRRFGRGPFSYRPGEPLAVFKVYFDKAAGAPPRFEIVSSAYRLRQSQCFLQSGGKLVCETCHNPHDIPRGAAAVQHYDAVCLRCHGATLTGLMATGKHTRAADCASCHMPKRRTDDVVHAVMTDHLIQRKPARDLLAVKENPETVQYHGEVVPYYPAQVTKDDALTVAAAQVVNNSNLTAGIPQLSEQIGMGPKSAEAYIVLGDAWRHSGHPHEAASAYESAAKLNPASARALRSWGVALKESGQTALAAETLKRAVQEMPDDPESWYELGLLDSEQSRPSDAITELRKAVTLDPDLAVGYNNLGGNLAAMGQMDAAEAAFRESLRIDPFDASAHGNMGRFLASKASLPQAAAELAKAVKLQPADAQNHYLYGLVLAQLGRFEEARKQAEAAVQANPNSAPGHELLGRLLEQRRNLDGALREYAEAVRIQPDFGRAHLDLAAALANRGDLTGAASQLRLAAAGKDAAAAREATEGLRQLENRH